MVTYSVFPWRASTCPLYSRPCGTPREWACRPTIMRCVSLGMADKESASSSGWLAQDLPRPLPGERWPEAAGALQFTELLEEVGRWLDPASYDTTSSHDTVEEMVRTHGSGPASSSLLCSLSGDALGLPKGAYLDLPRPREWRTAAGHYCETFAAYGIRPQDTVLRLPNRTIYILSHVQEFLAGLDSTWVDRLTRWTLGVQNALEEGEALPPFPTAAWTLGPQNGLEAGNELPPPPKAAGVAPETTDPAL